MTLGTKDAADLVMKVGGVGALLGAVLGALLWTNTTCTGVAGSSNRSCTNFFGQVDVNMLGQPEWPKLLGIGLLVGALVGGGIGAAITCIWPTTKPDLFP